MLCVKGIGKDHAKFSPVGEEREPNIIIDGHTPVFPSPPYT